MTIRYDKHKTFGPVSFEEYIEKNINVYKVLDEYIEELESKNYIYCIADLERKLDLKKQYVQKTIVPELDALFVNVVVKQMIKSAVFCPTCAILDIRVLNYKRLFSFGGKFHRQFQLMDNALLLDAANVKDVLSDRIYYLIENEKMNTYIPIDKADLDMILSLGVYSAATLKDIFGVSHDVQIYRIINRLLDLNIITKLAIINPNANSRNLIRYMITNRKVFKDLTNIEL